MDREYQTVKLTADSLRALEAYYYYIHIQEFEQAAKVLIKERSHRWGADVAIGRSIYRLKFLKQMIAVISSVVNHINSEYSLCKLYNILGDMYWLKGSMQEAIEYHSKSGKIAMSYNTKFKAKNQGNTINEPGYLDCFQNYSLFNLGLCQLNLGEPEQADYCFEKLKISENSSKLSNLQMMHNLVWHLLIHY